MIERQMLAMALALGLAGLGARDLQAQTAPGNDAAGGGAGQVAVVVTIPLPPGVPRAALPREFQASVPRYQALPGLLRKYYTIGDDHRFGGVYLWESRQAAEAWFTEAWRAQARATYGADPELTWFEAPVVIEGHNRLVRR